MNALNLRTACDVNCKCTLRLASKIHGSGMTAGALVKDALDTLHTLCLHLTTFGLYTEDARSNCSVLAQLPLSMKLTTSAYAESPDQSQSHSLTLSAKAVLCLCCAFSCHLSANLRCAVCPSICSDTFITYTATSGQVTSETLSMSAALHQSATVLFDTERLKVGRSLIACQTVLLRCAE